MEITSVIWSIMLAGIFAIVGVWAFMKVGGQAGRFRGAMS